MKFQMILNIILKAINETRYELALTALMLIEQISSFDENLFTYI